MVRFFSVQYLCNMFYIMFKSFNVLPLGNNNSISALLQSSFKIELIQHYITTTRCLVRLPTVTNIPEI